MGVETNHKSIASHEGYKVGHFWYYVLGGRPHYPSEIREEVRASGYQGYLRRDIAKLDQKADPARSAGLRRLREEVCASLRENIRIYRACVFQLHRYRALSAVVEAQPRCDDVHVSVGLKHSHIVNDFAHLEYLGALLNRQLELF